MSEEVSGFRRSNYSLLKRQEAGFTKTGSRILQTSIIVFFVRPDTIVVREENNICSRN